MQKHYLSINPPIKKKKKASPLDDPIAEIHKKDESGKYKKKHDLYIIKKKKKVNEMSKKELRKELSKKRNIRHAKHSDSSSEEEEENTFNTQCSLIDLKRGKAARRLELEHNYCIVPIKREYSGSERECLYVTGVSGSGKSTFIGKYLKSYKKLYPDNSIVVVSNVMKDEVLDIHDPIRFDKSKLVEDPFYDLSDLAHSCIIFDDTNSIIDNCERKTVNKLRDDILSTGRHHKISCVCTSHIALDREMTKFPIRESHICVVFPSGNESQVRDLLMRYCSFTKEQVEELLSIGSRWYAIQRHFPKYVLHKRGAWI